MRKIEDEPPPVPGELRQATVAVAAGGWRRPGVRCQGGWAATRIISPSQAATLIAMARHLFPHDALGDQYYAAAIEALDEQAAADPSSRPSWSKGSPSSTRPWASRSSSCRPAIS